MEDKKKTILSLMLIIIVIAMIVIIVDDLETARAEDRGHFTQGDNICTYGGECYPTAYCDNQIEEEIE